MQFIGDPPRSLKKLGPVKGELNESEEAAAESKCEKISYSRHSTVTWK